MRNMKPETAFTIYLTAALLFITTVAVVFMANSTVFDYQYGPRVSSTLEKGDTLTLTSEECLVVTAESSERKFVIEVEGVKYSSIAEDVFLIRPWSWGNWDYEIHRLGLEEVCVQKPLAEFTETRYWKEGTVLTLLEGEDVFIEVSSPNWPSGRVMGLYTPRLYVFYIMTQVVLVVGTLSLLYDALVAAPKASALHLIGEELVGVMRAVEKMIIHLSQRVTRRHLKEKQP